MNTLARRGNGHQDASDEVEKLREALDTSYAQMRELASEEWHRRCTADDPTDACVHVHIERHPQHALGV